MMDVLQRQNPKVGGGLREVLCMCVKVDHDVCVVNMLGCVYTGNPMQIFFPQLFGTSDTNVIFSPIC
jgi:hypothetical protein